MKNLWNHNTSKDYIDNYKKFGVNKDLALRIYTTHGNIITVDGANIEASLR